MDRYDELASAWAKDQGWAEDEALHERTIAAHALKWNNERREKETCETFREQAIREARADLIANDLAVISLLLLQREHDKALELARTIEIQFDANGEPIARGRRIVEVKDE